MIWAFLFGAWVAGAVAVAGVHYVIKTAVSRALLIDRADQLRVRILETQAENARRQHSNLIAVAMSTKLSHRTGHRVTIYPTVNQFVRSLPHMSAEVVGLN